MYKYYIMRTIGGSMDTNLDEIKEAAIILLHIDPEPVKEIPIFLSHPFFETAVQKTPDEDNLFNIFEDDDRYRKLLAFTEDSINRAKTAIKIFMFIRPQYRLTLFKYSCDYMSESDFEDILLYSWQSSEFPSYDVNVTKQEYIKWFKSLNYKSNFPEIVTIYRGVKKYGEIGMSWTLSEDKAVWFAQRYNKDKGIVYKAKIKNKDILYYIDSSEQEIIVDPKKLMQIEEI